MSTPPLQFVFWIEHWANNIQCTSTPRSPSMAWRRMITSASTPLRELVYLATNNWFIQRNEPGLLLVWYISRGSTPQPHMDSSPCMLFGGCHQEDNTPLRQDPRLKYHQPLPPFRPHRRMLPRPAKGPLPRTLRLLMPPGCSVNGHFKSIESHLHDGYYTTKTPVKDFVTEEGRSLMKIRNRRPAKTVPWGIPDKTVTNLDCTPSITTLCFLFDRKSSIQGKILRIP